MEPAFVFEKIKAALPANIFFPLTYYVLEWLPPGSDYLVRIPLDDPEAQDGALQHFAALKRMLQRRIVFYFTTQQPGAPLFIEALPPGALKDYHTRNKVIKAITEQYMDGHLTLLELSELMCSSNKVWCTHSP
jgi:hypothetical protein